MPGVFGIQLTPYEISVVPYYDVSLCDYVTCNLHALDGNSNVLMALPSQLTPHPHPNPSVSWEATCPAHTSVVLSPSNSYFSLTAPGKTPSRTWLHKEGYLDTRGRCGSGGERGGESGSHQIVWSSSRTFRHKANHPNHRGKPRRATATFFFFFF